MAYLNTDRLVELVASPELVWGTIGGGFALLALALLVLMLTRLGQSHPLRKCVFLSLAAHLLFASMLSTVHVATTAGKLPEVQNIKIVSTSTEELEPPRQLRAAPWEQIPQDLPNTVANADRLAPDASSALDRAPTEAPLAPDTTPRSAIDDSPRQPAPGQIEAVAPASDPTQAKSPEAIETTAAARQDNANIAAEAGVTASRLPVTAEMERAATEPSPGRIPSSLLDRTSHVPRLDEPHATPNPESALLSPREMPPRVTAAAPDPHAIGLVAIEKPAEASLRGNDPGRQLPLPSAPHFDGADPAGPEVRPEVSPRLTFRPRNSSEREVPEIYKLRVAPDRAQQAVRQGGSEQSEEAVVAALDWLSKHQEADGRWDATKHGAGREGKVLGHDRQGAGSRADTGVSGLALLAFLGAGHTHLEGDYQKTVQHGLEFLLRSQARDGNLAGKATLYAAMYCHGMATLAISEAYAMTQDERLELPLRKAVAYSLSAQHPTEGGWRYRPGDWQGDASQFGWQLMALRSAKLSGIDIPPRAEQGMLRFLKSVTFGTHGGLASYRANEKISPTMTAEAFVCRRFLGLPDDSNVAQEAGDYLLLELPGNGEMNFYYWYYGTLAMHQMQGPHWEKWNAALRPTLINSQRQDGDAAGSWDTKTVWGGYGGRVYTTAMGALCLEVYYRYLPLYEARD